MNLGQSRSRGAQATRQPDEDETSTLLKSNSWPNISATAVNEPEERVYDFTFWKVLCHFEIWTSAMCIAISLMCLTFKEPVLAIKLSDYNLSVTQKGWVFAVDPITYIIASACLNFVKEEKNGKKYGRL